MKLKNIITMLRTPNLLGQFLLMRDWQPFIRLHFLYSAIDSGLLDALRTPSSRKQLVQTLQVQRPELLDALLNLGVSLDELSVDGELYRVKGRRSKTVMDQANDSFVALMQEHITYYNSVYRHAAVRLQGAPLGDHLDEIASLVARASKATEPFVLGFLEDAVAGKDSVRILDVGCGSGVHLRSALGVNPQTTGIGIDMDKKVVQQAKDNLAQWGIDEQFRVLVADIRTPPGELDGPFDLITLFNVIYYFPVDERPTLFRTLASMLAPGGAVALVSSFQGKDVWAANLDLATRSTLGCAPLPELDEITQQFRESGFGQIKKVRLMPSTPFHGILATRAG